jgi:acetyl-CoA synthetase
MSDTLIPVPEQWRARAYWDKAGYDAATAEALADPDGFWLKQAARLDWMKKPAKAGNWSYDPDRLSIKWFEDGELNVAANCIDRHLAARGERTAIIWEGDDPKDSRHISFSQLHEEVCRFANVLTAHGVRKGDRVTIYMPMIPEAAFAMLACARIGAPHSVVFGGFSPDSLAGRIQDCDSRIVITADEACAAARR